MLHEWGLFCNSDGCQQIGLVKFPFTVFEVLNLDYPFVQKYIYAVIDFAQIHSYRHGEVTLVHLWVSFNQAKYPEMYILVNKDFLGMDVWFLQATAYQHRLLTMSKSIINQKN